MDAIGSKNTGRPDVEWQRQDRLGATPVTLEDRYRSRGLPNAMTVDVEEYFQVSAFEDVVAREDWPDIASRLPKCIDNILALFDAEGVKATFFVLGWVSQRHGRLIRRIADEGHEIASHGHEHLRVTKLGRDSFRQDVENTRKRLEDTTSSPVIGYRAPSFSIGRETPWAHDELSEAGYQYSSSVFPIQHDHYGQPTAPRFPYRPSPSGVMEIPLSTVKLLGRNLPCSGGGYFRLMPFQFSRWAIRKINGSEQLPAIFYFHPWELDPDQPRIAGLPVKARFRHYVNLGRFKARLTKMLREFDWNRIDRIFMGEQ